MRAEPHTPAKPKSSADRPSFLPWQDRHALSNILCLRAGVRSTTLVVTAVQVIRMKVLIAIDRSEYAEIVLEHGLDQASRSAADEIHVVTAVDVDAPDTDRAIADGWLEAAVGDLIETFRCEPRTVMLHVRRGQPAEVIAALADELVPDLLVIGRFHVPSAAEAISGLVRCPTLVVGIDGHLLEPQCPECERTRRESDGEALFCAAHEGDRLPDLVSRLPRLSQLGSRLW